MRLLKRMFTSMLNVIQSFCKVVYRKSSEKIVVPTTCVGSTVNPTVFISSSTNITNPPQKCVILVPCNSSIEHKTDESLRILEAKGYEVWRTPGWSAIDQGRNRMAYDAIYRRGFEEIFWIDSDILFNPNDIERVRSWNKDIVAGAYPMKGWPIMTVQPFPGKSVEFREYGGLEEVMCVATGFLYIKSNVFHVIKEKLNLPECNTSFSAPQIPFFQPAIWKIEGEQYYLGEDFSFCMRARNSGFTIWLDTGIKLGHIGKYTYEWADVIKKTGMEPKLEGKCDFVYNPFTSIKTNTTK